MASDFEFVSKNTERDYTNIIVNCNESAFQHSLGWRDVIERTFGFEPFYFIFKKKGEVVAVFPSFIKKTKLGNVMNSLPVSGSHGGICFSNSVVDKEELAKEILNPVLDFAKEKDCLTSTIITSPFSDSCHYAGFNFDFVLPRFTQVIDLQEYPQYSIAVRRSIKKAKKIGVVTTSSVDKPNFLDGFWKIHEKNMIFCKQNVKPKEFFSNIQEIMGKKGAEFNLAHYEDKLIAGVLTVKFKNTIYFHEINFDREFKKERAVSLLVDTLLSGAKKSGFENANFGASPSREHGVYAFKKSFGAFEQTYSYFTKAHTPMGELKNFSLSEVKNNFKWFYFLPFELFV
jgi:hypothetical protein